MHNFTQEDLAEIIDVARGTKEGDLLLTNGKIINVFNESVETGNILIHKGIIVGIGPYEKAKKVINVNKSYISPSFTDAHLHIESTMSIPPEFARAVVPLGTTTAVADPHEIANVAGIPGIQFMINSTKNLPMDIYFMLSSCVPATPLESSGAHLYAEDLAIFKNDSKVLGLAEMMNYPGLLAKDPEVLAKIAISRDRIIDGHSPGLTGKDLNAYLASGVMADHECTTPEEAKEKLSKGMWIMMREGSLTRDVQRLIPILNEHTKHRILLCTDDKHPEDLVHEGHINFAISLLIKNKVPLPLAIRLATLNPASFFGFKRSGGIAPGYSADIVVFKNILKIEKVFKNGKLVAESGKPLFEFKGPLHDDAVKNTINIRPVTFNDLKVPVKGNKIRVIGIHPDTVFTSDLHCTPSIKNELVISDIKKDVIKIAVIERHKATGNVGVGFINGLGLKSGAFATSVSHDSHNIIVTGTNDKDMLLAVAQVEAMGGGIAVTKKGKVLGSLALPYGGLMTNRSINETSKILIKLHKIVKKENGTAVPDPFMTLAFMSLAVIPKLKITDKGLVDVDKFAFVPLFVRA
ncbi:MAG: adenine deaminase [Caldiserica bacterium]|nr:MAG: adenine deaminase [Caldisericota bacterium]